MALALVVPLPGSRIEVDIGYTGLAIGRLEVTITLEGGQVLSSLDALLQLLLNLGVDPLMSSHIPFFGHSLYRL